MKSFAPAILESSRVDSRTPSVLVPIDPPEYAEGTGGWASWHTWSPEFRRLLVRLADSVDPAWPAPHIQELRPGERYATTFALAPQVEGDSRWRQLQGELRRYAVSLVTMPRPSRVLLLTGLREEGTPWRALRFVLAALRRAIVEIFDDQDAAYYAPLGSTGPSAGGFAAHSDLYVPELLMNIFEDVPGDGSGASVFISAKRFCELLRETPAVPEKIEHKVRALLRDELQDDGFEDFYRTLYGRGVPWSEPLQAALARKQTRIVMRAGDGYLIHDRLWLHGREAPSCGVSANRLHRLVFRHARSGLPIHSVVQRGEMS
jgi:hypothetical protein